jgi:NCS1 family nucleobase:cation symporter-1
VLIVDYWILRKRTLDLAALYLDRGAYRYQGGVNVPAVTATLAGAAVAMAGMFWEPLRPIYDWSWFVGFGLAGGLYWVMMQGAVPPSGVPAGRIAPPR